MENRGNHFYHHMLCANICTDRSSISYIQGIMSIVYTRLFHYEIKKHPYYNSVLRFNLVVTIIILSSPGICKLFYIVVFVIYLTISNIILYVLQYLYFQTSKCDQTHKIRGRRFALNIQI